MRILRHCFSLGEVTKTAEWSGITRFFGVSHRTLQSGGERKISEDCVGLYDYKLDGLNYPKFDRLQGERIKPIHDSFDTIEFCPPFWSSQDVFFSSRGVSIAESPK